MGPQTISCKSFDLCPHYMTLGRTHNDKVILKMRWSVFDTQWLLFFLTQLSSSPLFSISGGEIKLHVAE